MEKEKYSPILSISDAEQQLCAWKREDKEKEDFPIYIAKSIQGSSDIYGTADEYHNLSSEFARKDLYKCAEIVAGKGAERYKHNVDLLADVIKFGSQSQDWDICETAYKRLDGIKYEKWTWRAFTFVIEYLMDKMEILGEDEKEEEIYKKIYAHIDAYKKLNDERAWVAEAELNIKYGKRSEAIATLKTGIDNIQVAPQCCLKIIDLLLENGSYEEVIKYSAIGIRGTAQDQPSASNGYLLYTSALAKDALINEEEIENGEGVIGKGFHNFEAVKSALVDYEIAKQLLYGRSQYIYNINQRMLILKVKSGIEFDKEINE